MTEPEPEVKHTEQSMLKLLRVRHAEDSGNGPAWAYMEHVRNLSGFTSPGKTKTIDALALHLWQSRGHDLHAYEVKVSRSDWRAELRKPDKAEAWCAIADYFWIVAPRGIVPRDELPATWGLLETRGDGMAVTVQAPRLRSAADRPALSRGLLACLLRAAGTGLQATPEAKALAAAREEGWLKGHTEGVQSAGDWQRLYETGKQREDANATIVQEIESALGMQFRHWRDGVDRDRLKAVSEGLRALAAGDDVLDRARQSSERAAAELERQAAWIREHAGRHG